MGMLEDAFNEVRQEEVKWEEPLIDFKEITGTYAERAQLSHIINTIARGTEIGKKILEKAARNGYTLKMASLSGVGGFCNSQKKTIVLNSDFSESFLVSTLVHEARHAEQAMNATWTGERGSFVVESDLMLSRAKEADAQAIAAAACFEIRSNTGNSEPLCVMYDKDAYIMGALEKAAKSKKAPVTEKMLQAAFKGWYEGLEKVEAYEKSYQCEQMQYAVARGDYSTTPYSKKLSSSQIVTALCKTSDGMCYFEDDKDVLSDRDRCSVCQETAEEFERFFKLREKTTGQPTDKTYETLKVRDAFRGFRNTFNDLKRAFSSEYRKTSYRDKNDEIGLKKEGSSSDIRRINHLVNDLCEDNESRKKLMSLKTAGYAIGFENAMRVGSVRDDYKKVVLLNPALKDDKLKDALLAQSEKIAARTAVQTRMAAAQFKGR